METLIYKIPHGLDWGYLSEKLIEEIHFKEEQSIDECLAVFDTFDWRLFKNSLTLIRSKNSLSLKRLSNTSALYSIEPGVDPEFAQDLPDSELREKISPIIEIRALMKMAEVFTRTTTCRVLNPDEKTVAWLAREEIHLTDERLTPNPATYVTLKPVRGYPKSFRGLSNLLEGAKLTTVTRESIFYDILEFSGKKPGNYYSKPQIRLEPGMRTDEAIKNILRFLLQVMQSNETGIKQDIDTEFLHEFRVAVRRTRSAISQVKGVFPIEQTVRFKRDFAYLGDLTNELRDLDVYLLKEETYRSRLPVALRKDIDLLFEYLKQKRTLALQEVIQGLDSEGYSQILADWETFLNMPPQDTPNTPNANRPIKEVAQQRINKRYRGAIKLGNRIIAMRDYEQLHYLRIECKKLRYLMEFFSSLFHTKKITTLINQLKKLQDNLGDYNDLCMQQEYLLNIANEIDTSEPESKMTLLAIGSLIGSMEDERQRVRESFDQIFSKFAASKNKAIARELFSSKTKKAAS